MGLFIALHCRFLSKRLCLGKVYVVVVVVVLT